MYRKAGQGLEVLLAHPGGPFWRHRDSGAWSIPKGELEPGEAAEAAARREFFEETGLRAAERLIELGEVKQKAGKIVQAWACEGDAEATQIKSNLTRVELPRGSGRWIQVPEVDKADWFSPDEAREKINPAQAEFIDRLEAALKQ